MIATPRLTGSKLERLLAQVKDIRRKLAEVEQNDEGPGDAAAGIRRVE
jgi:hypothetical protein